MSDQVNNENVMIKAIMQVDLNNTLALQYLELALKSYECVSDIFKEEVMTNVRRRILNKSRQQCNRKRQQLFRLTNIDQQMKGIERCTNIKQS